jgi:Zn-finger nucleic acid-binding protein
VWLDRGELDKIIERNAGMQTGPMERRPPPPERYDDDYHRQRKHDDDDDYHKRRKRRGFLGELFDFD